MYFSRLKDLRGHNDLNQTELAKKFMKQSNNIVDMKKGKNRNTNKHVNNIS